MRVPSAALGRRRPVLRAAFLAFGLGFPLCLALPAAAEATPAPPHAVAGELRPGDLAVGERIPLEGEWLFVPGRLLGAADDWSGAVKRSVPDRWKGDDAGGASGMGAGSYRLRIVLPGPREDLGLRFTTTGTSFELEVNGAVLGGAGRPSTDPRYAIPAYAPGVLRFDAPDGVVDVIVRISNHEYRTGGMWRTFVLGDGKTLARIKRARDIGIFAFASITLAFAINSLAIYLFRRKERAFLAFGVFSLVIALRSITTNEYVILQVLPGLSFDALVRLEYVSTYFSIPAGMAYFMSIFREEARPAVRAVLLVPFLAFGQLIFWAPLPLLTRSLTPFYPVAIGLIAAGCLLVYVPALLHRRQGALGLLPGILVLAGAAASDMLFQSFLVQSPSILMLALGLFVLSQALMLARRLVFSFEEVEALSDQLARTNAQLEEEIQGCKEAHARLEVLLVEKETYLREMHHRVKNSLQIVSSVISLQSHRLSGAEAIEAFSSLRDRIRAISLVHEKLYGTSSDEGVDLRDYAADLVRQLSRSFDTEAGVITMDIAPGLPLVRMEVCLDLGFVLAELVSNSCKHALVNRAGSGLAVRLCPEGDGVLLAVRDDGPGFPASFDPGSTSSLGFKIIMSIVRKYGGSVELSGGRGATVLVRLPLGGVADDPPLDAAMAAARKAGNDA